MRRMLCIIAIWVGLLTGCTSTHHYEDNVESYDEINEKTRAKDVEIRLASGQTTYGYYFEAAVDSTRWVESFTLRTNIVPTSEVSEIYSKNRRRGAVIGFCVAAGIGALAGAAWGSFNEGMDDIPGSDQGYIQKTALAGGLICGVVLGLPIGAAVGGKNKFILHVSVDSIYKNKKSLRERRGR
jgi:hypothetical protein